MDLPSALFEAGSFQKNGSIRTAMLNELAHLGLSLGKGAVTCFKEHTLEDYLPDLIVALALRLSN